MQYQIKAKRVIEQLVKSGHKNFVVFPYGERGILVKALLNSYFGIQETMIIDNNLCRENKHIHAIEEIKNIDVKDIIVLLSTDSEAYYSDIRQELLTYVSLDKIVDVFSPSIYFDEKVYFDKPYYSQNIPEQLYFYDARIMSLEENAREIYRRGISGCTAEVGVYKGEFANYISRFFPDRRLYLFDTFSGFDDRDIDAEEEKYSAVFRKNVSHADTSAEIALSNIGWRSNAVAKTGYFPDTVTGLENEKFCFVCLDTDLYKPILAGLEFFYPRMIPGGCIFVDDLGHQKLPGVRKAVIDFCQKEHVGYSSIYDGSDATAVIVKPL